jgi:shikimate dehydrogenase
VIRLALLGRPVVHSRSPAMMRAAFAAMGVEGAYVPFDIAPEGLGDAVRALVALGFDGANVTVPHKVAVMAHLAATDADARLAGAVNTLVRTGDGFVGYNTDIAGLREALAHGGASAQGEAAVVLGAGGASRAAAVALVRDGATRVDVVARRFPEALALVEVVERAGAAGRAHRLGDASVSNALGAARVVVQATSCGMTGGNDTSELLAGADLRACGAGAVAVDLVYAPAVTPWMHAAEAAGMRVLAGAGARMLAGQGAAALARWTGREAPIDVMRAALGL